ncbi:MAG: UDP-N-acetylglucosamine 2-epimerase [Gemmatimonadota bacterium]|nr:UDP-N-acetylglucosamine 2-epimerase [Gemmatimonadota bacterium]
MNGPRLLFAYQGRADYARVETVLHAVASTGLADPRVLCARSPGRDPRLDYFRGGDLRAPVLFLRLDEGAPDFRLGRMLIALGGLVARLRPELVVTAGGTDIALALALVAARRGVPAARLDGGVRAPAEARDGAALRTLAARRIADHAASLLFARDETTARRLVGEGLPRERIRVAGDPLDDFLRLRLAGGPAAAPDAAGRRTGPEERGEEAEGQTGGFLLVLLRGPALDAPDLDRLWARIGALAEERAQQALVPVEPRLAARLREEGLRWDHPLVRPIEALPFEDVLGLLRRAALVVTDCEEILDEAGLLGVPGASAFQVARGQVPDPPRSGRPAAGPAAPGGPAPTGAAHGPGPSAAIAAALLEAATRLDATPEAIGLEA